MDYPEVTADAMKEVTRIAQDKKLDVLFIEINKTALQGESLYWWTVPEAMTDSVPIVIETLRRRGFTVSESTDSDGTILYISWA